MIDPHKLLDHQRRYLVPASRTLRLHLQSALDALSGTDFRICNFNQGRMYLHL
jgi:hypothetical protein